jgi:hypothetical protein
LALQCPIHSHCLIHPHFPTHPRSSDRNHSFGANYSIYSTLMLSSCPILDLVLLITASNLLNIPIPSSVLILWNVPAICI